MPQTRFWPSAVVLAAAFSVSACGITSATTTGSGTYSAHASASTPATQDRATASRRTPGAALANYVRDTAVGNRSAACEDAGAATVSGGMKECMGPAGTPAWNSLHKDFASFGIGPGTPIRVTVPHFTGESVTISAGDVRVAGTTLLVLILRHSTGIKPGQFSMSWVMERIDGAWYATNMNMNLG